MKSRFTVCALTIAALGVGSVAQAQQQWQPAHQRQWQGQPSHQGEGQRQWQGQHWQAQRQWQQPYHAPQYRAYNHAPRYYGAPRYAIGGYVPHAYRAHRYWVSDWRAYRLAPPPYGYQWVETDSGDFLLMALATGLIASAILSSY
jgi:Ni/Co efflux regulator RcnB